MLKRRYLALGAVLPLCMALDLWLSTPAHHPTSVQTSILLGVVEPPKVLPQTYRWSDAFDDALIWQGDFNAVSRLHEPYDATLYTTTTTPYVEQAYRALRSKLGGELTSSGAVRVVKTSNALFAVHYDPARAGGVLYKFDELGALSWRMTFAGLEASAKTQNIQIFAKDGRIKLQVMEGRRAFVLQVDAEGGDLLRRVEVPWELVRARTQLKTQLLPGHELLRTTSFQDGAPLTLHYTPADPAQRGWKLALAHHNISTPVKHNSSLIFASYDPGNSGVMVYRLDRDSGELIWAQRAKVSALEPKDALEIPQGVTLNVDAEHGLVIVESKDTQRPDRMWQEILEVKTGQVLARHRYLEMD